MASRLVALIFFFQIMEILSVRERIKSGSRLCGRGGGFVYCGSQTCYGALHQVLQFYRGSDTCHSGLFRLGGLEGEVGGAVNVEGWLGVAGCYQIVVDYRCIFLDLRGEFQDARGILHLADPVEWLESL